MDYNDLDSLDKAIAGIEGLGPQGHDLQGADRSAGQPAYQPTRDPDEALRLMDKYIAKAVKMTDGWAAVGPNGRACFGVTLPIAVCVAIVEAR